MSESDEDHSVEAQYNAIRKLMAGKTVINRVPTSLDPLLTMLQELTDMPGEMAQEVGDQVDAAMGQMKKVGI